jgi:hypothetical protein
MDLFWERKGNVCVHSGILLAALVLVAPRGGRADDGSDPMQNQQLTEHLQHAVIRFFGTGPLVPEALASTKFSRAAFPAVEFKPVGIRHLAAIRSIPPDYTSPPVAYEENKQGLRPPLEATGPASLWAADATKC